MHNVTGFTDVQELVPISTHGMLIGTGSQSTAIDVTLCMAGRGFRPARGQVGDPARRAAGPLPPRNTVSFMVGHAVGAAPAAKLAPPALYTGPLHDLDKPIP